MRTHDRTHAPASEANPRSDRRTERILVGIDEEQAAHVAVDWVIERARQRRVSIELVSVTDLLMMEDPELETRLELAAAHVRATCPGARVGTRRVDGPIVESLGTVARDADLLVIGSHRRRPIRSALAGWLPLRIAIHAPCPTVIVPDDRRVGGEKIVVGVDEDGSSDRALDLAAAESLAADQPVEVVHAWLQSGATWNRTDMTIPDHAESRAHHRSVLDRAADRVRRSGAKTTAILAEEPAPEMLARHAERASMVVIGTHRHGPVAGALLGSVGQQILLDSRAAVCIVPEGSPGTDD